MTLAYQIDQMCARPYQRRDTPQSLDRFSPRFHEGYSKLTEFFRNTTYYVTLDVELAPGSLQFREKDNPIVMRADRGGILEEYPPMLDQVQNVKVSVYIELGVPHYSAMQKALGEVMRFKDLRKAEVVVISRSQVQSGMWPGLSKPMVRIAGREGIEVTVNVVWLEPEDDAEDGADDEDEVEERCLGSILKETEAAQTLLSITREGVPHHNRCRPDYTNLQQLEQDSCKTVLPLRNRR